MKNILVPCDFSEPSREALKFASALAADENVQVFVLRVIELPFLFESAFGVQPYVFDPKLLTGLEENVRSSFDKIKTDLGLDEHSVAFHVVHGQVALSIIRFIEDKKIDLVVMGTHGASGLKEFFIGSNTEKVVRLSPVPVFAIKKAPAISAIKNIVFPSMLDNDQDELVRHVKSLQKFFNARLHILLVNTPMHFKTNRESKDMMREFERKYDFSNHTLNVRNDSFEQDAIIDFVKEIGADLIAMGTHGRRGVMHLLTGSIAEDVVNHAQYPIWTYSLRH